ncbi:4'-phosphopantetheinyl transferase family protein [Streptomyces sp. NBC_01304]|uniref:4'-phosphopantetheinyl transferase family protein n=1 Tax=Streptomyces sp. NBC_01304 TaxID=2903818 RepID=UPI002E126204|nr:4'-phosphopantetheinyl transferase superfamily protein [Streptomyces sp. NBC_01304]
MIELLLPLPVATADTFHDVPDAPLFPAEERVVAASTPERRREFTTVRACARAALRDLGRAPAPILPDDRGAPVWPTGTVGSMTHCAGYLAAAVAPAPDIAAVGIDAEPNLPIATDGARKLVMLPEERSRAAALRAHRPEIHWDRLVFSAKEAVFKVWFPLTGRELEFEEVFLTVDPESQSFRALLLVPGPVVDGRNVQELSGTWLLGRGTLLTAIALTRDGASLTGDGPVPNALTQKAFSCP